MNIRKQSSFIGKHKSRHSSQEKCYWCLVLLLLFSYIGIRQKKKKLMRKANAQGKKDKYSNREDDFYAITLSILKYKTINRKIIGTDRFEWCGWIQDKYTKKSKVFFFTKIDIRLPNSTIFLNKWFSLQNYDRPHWRETELTVNHSLKQKLAASFWWPK